MNTRHAKKNRWRRSLENGNQFRRNMYLESTNSGSLFKFQAILQLNWNIGCADGSIFSLFPSRDDLKINLIFGRRVVIKFFGALVDVLFVAPIIMLLQNKTRQTSEISARSRNIGENRTLWILFISEEEKRAIKNVFWRRFI